RRLLTERGVSLQVYDPYVPTLSTVVCLEGALEGATAVMLATNHSAFVEHLTPATLQKYGIKLVVDGKNCLDAEALAQSGIAYYGVGRASTGLSK
ncbi:MAG: UDP binding domain-containing protein, partial [Candidatus Andersenbacteria bacterium]